VEELAGTLVMTTEDCAWGIHQVVNEHMAAAARMHIIERGHDPRRFTLVASGGAGPAHVASVARHLGALHYILPRGAGTLASFGCLVAPAIFAAERTFIAPLQEVTWEKVRGLFAAMRDEAEVRLAAMGVDAAQITMTYATDMRMVGQIHHIQIALTPDELAGGAQAAITARFHERYAHLFARTNLHMPLEFVNWRLMASGNPPPLTLALLPQATGESASVARKGERMARFAEGGFRTTPVYDRYALAAGMVVSGPAIVEERESTAILPPGNRATVDRYGNLLVEVGNT
jgi:5-oxoprolinase (ATP-hydrolysing)/N-methylhydantoinase A